MRSNTIKCHKTQIPILKDYIFILIFLSEKLSYGVLVRLILKYFGEGGGGLNILLISSLKIAFQLTNTDGFQLGHYW